MPRRAGECDESDGRFRKRQIYGQLYLTAADFNRPYRELKQRADYIAFRIREWRKKKKKSEK